MAGTSGCSCSGGAAQEAAPGCRSAHLRTSHIDIDGS